MAIDKHVGVELLKGQRDSWARKSIRNYIFGVAQTMVGALTAGPPLIRGIDRIVNNDAYLANWKLLDTASFVVGSLVFGAGFYTLVRGVMASHKADELALRIAEIEKSPNYKTSQAPRQ